MFDNRRQEANPLRAEGFESTITLSKPSPLDETHAGQKPGLNKGRDVPQPPGMETQGAHGHRRDDNTSVKSSAHSDALCRRRRLANSSTTDVDKSCAATARTRGAVCAAKLTPMRRALGRDARPGRGRRDVAAGSGESARSGAPCRAGHGGRSPNGGRRRARRAHFRRINPRVRDLQVTAWCGSSRPRGPGVSGTWVEVL